MSVKLKSKSRKKKKNNSRLILLLFFVMLLSGLGLSIHSLSQQEAYYSAKLAELESRLEEENLRSESFEELEKYHQTLRFIEQIARERLNLVFPGEIIVKPAD